MAYDSDFWTNASQYEFNWILVLHAHSLSVLQVFVWEGHDFAEFSVAELLASLRNRYGMGIWSESSIPIRTTDGHIPAKIETLKASDVYKSFMRLKRPGKAVTDCICRCWHDFRHVA